MRVTIHADEVFNAPRFAFSRVPDGVYESRATVHPDSGEPYDIQWRIELKDGTVYYSWPGTAAGPVDAQLLKQIRW